MIQSSSYSQRHDILFSGCLEAIMEKYPVYLVSWSLQSGYNKNHTLYLMRALKPKAFIKATEKTQQYECVICNYIAQKPYICRGPCNQNFCFQCANCIKNNKNQCPFKCSKPFDLQQCKEVELEFNCPFQSEQCEQYIGSISQFYNHANECKFVPQGWKEKQENYRKYRCQKGHDLYFLDEKDLFSLYGYKFYEQPTNSTCSNCGEKGLCRSICPLCSKKNQQVLFCTNCRKPPCTKKTCLYEHSLVKSSCMYQRSLICDFCGTAAYLLGPNAFRDTQCNFDICEVCFINLPDTHELVPFKTPHNVIDHLKHNGMEESDSEEEEALNFVMPLEQGQDLEEHEGLEEQEQGH